MEPGVGDIERESLPRIIIVIVIIDGKEGRGSPQDVSKEPLLLLLRKSPKEILSATTEQDYFT